MSGLAYTRLVGEEPLHFDLGLRFWQGQKTVALTFRACPERREGSAGAELKFSATTSSPIAVLPELHHPRNNPRRRNPCSPSVILSPRSVGTKDLYHFPLRLPPASGWSHRTLLLGQSDFRSLGIGQGLPQPWDG
jgi:hypothetical protein